MGKFINITLSPIMGFVQTYRLRTNDDDDDDDSRDYTIKIINLHIKNIRKFEEKIIEINLLYVQIR